MKVNLDTEIVLTRHAADGRAAYYGRGGAIEEVELWGDYREASGREKVASGTEIATRRVTVYVRDEDMPSPFDPKEWRMSANGLDFDIVSAAASWQRGRYYQLTGEARS